MSRGKWLRKKGEEMVKEPIVNRTGIAQEVSSTSETPIAILAVDTVTKYADIIKNLESRLSDIELFRNAESIENRIRSLSEEFDNLTSLVNGIKQDILNNVKKYSEEEIRVKVNDEVKKLMEKMTK